MWLTFFIIIFPSWLSFILADIVNLNNYHTIEFRLFRGTLKYNTFIATLQMVNHICDAAISLSEEGIDAMSWSEFVSSIRETELIQYLKERRLYVNEMVAESEEM